MRTSISAVSSDINICRLLVEKRKGIIALDRSINNNDLYSVIS